VVGDQVLTKHRSKTSTELYELRYIYSSGTSRYLFTKMEEHFFATCGTEQVHSHTPDFLRWKLKKFSFTAPGVLGFSQDQGRHRMGTTARLECVFSGRETYARAVAGERPYSLSWASCLLREKMPRTTCRYLFASSPCPSTGIVTAQRTPLPRRCEGKKRRGGKEGSLTRRRRRRCRFHA
jgi:hypothetical protein